MMTNRSQPGAGAGDRSARERLLREAAEIFDQVAADDLDETALAAWLEQNSMAL